MPFFRRPTAQTNSTAYGGSTSNVPHYNVYSNRRYASSNYPMSSASSSCSEAGSQLSDLPYLHSVKSFNVHSGSDSGYSSASSVKSGRSIRQKLTRAFSGNRRPSTSSSSRNEMIPPVPKLSKEYMRAMVSRSPSPLSPVATTVYEEDENNPTPRRCQTSMSNRLPSSKSNNSIFSYARAVHGQPSQPSLHPQLTIQHALPRHAPLASPGHTPKSRDKRSTSSRAGARISHQRHGSMPAANELSRLSAEQNFVFTTKRYGGIGLHQPPRSRSSSFDPSPPHMQRIPSPSLASVMGSRPFSPESTVSTPFRIRRKPVPSFQPAPKAKEEEEEDADVSIAESPLLRNDKAQPPIEETLELDLGDKGEGDSILPSPEPEKSFRRELDVLFEELLDACQSLAADTAPSSPTTHSTSREGSVSVPQTPKKMPMRPTLTPPSKRVGLGLGLGGLGRGSPSPQRARSATCSTQSTDGPVTPIDKAKSAARRKADDRHFFGGRVEQVTPRKLPKAKTPKSKPTTPSRVRYQIRQIERIVSEQASPESSSRISTPLKGEFHARCRKLTTALEAILNRPCSVNSVELTREVKSMSECSFCALKTL